MRRGEETNWTRVERKIQGNMVFQEDALRPVRQERQEVLVAGQNHKTETQDRIIEGNRQRKRKTEIDRHQGRQTPLVTDTIGDFPFLAISGTSQDIVRQNKCPCPVDIKGHMKDPII